MFALWPVGGRGAWMDRGNRAGMLLPTVPSGREVRMLAPATIPGLLLVMIVLLVLLVYGY